LADYPVREIEERWQKWWVERDIYRTPEPPQKKYYVLEMFLYPSGDMHMGHARNYTIGDVMYRYRRMQGFDALHPFGWDAFGLPAENAAIKHGNHPADWTFSSIDLCRRNLNLLGISYDWNREVTTANPDYYRWNQWLFIKFFERGLAYRKEAYVNWCTGCQTVLANEQVAEGACYRCKSVVEKRKLTQWFFKITEYAQRLLDGLDTLPGWPENVKAMQRNWIGRSEGCEVDFVLADTGEKFPIFTTRPDTLFGVTFMALAPDAALAETIARGTDREKEVREFIQRVLQRPEIERTAQTGDKEGIFTGKYAVNPLTGDKVPIYIADFVLGSYGTGMIMAVPAHDQRDFEFARKYKIPIKVVIQPAGTGFKESRNRGIEEHLNPGILESSVPSSSPDPRPLTPETMTAAYVDEGVMTNSRQFDGLSNLEGIGKVIDYLVEKGIGRKVVNYRLKDWLVSRQRYWGTPIPMIHCPTCGVVPVPEKDLPVLLPRDVKDYKPKGKSVLAGIDEFYHTVCPRCGGKATRDPDTMDTFVDSSWYYLRYTDAHNDTLPFAPDRANRWLPIDDYIGGIEHACGHLIFFRFFHKVLHDMGMLATDEPNTRLHTHGLVHLDGKVMSSSKRIGIWVGDFVKEHGADVARLAVLFAAPPDKGMDWHADTPIGVGRFIARLYTLFQDNLKTVSFTPVPRPLTPGPELQLYIRLNQTIKKVLDDLESFQFNTAIAALMEFLNDLTEFQSTRAQARRSASSDSTLDHSATRPLGHPEDSVFGFALGRLIYLLAPFAPHLAEELWHQTGHSDSILDQRLPDYDPAAVQFDQVEIPIQVNGKLRSRLVVARGLPEAEIRKLALADSRTLEYTKGAQVMKVIYIPNRLVNIVVSSK
jgi:leucyl-tRNA synthetase